MMTTWFERIEAAKRRGRWCLGPFKRFTFSHEEKELALNWGTCGVGEAIHLDGFNVPLSRARTRVGVPPADHVLEALGINFYRAVRSGRPVEAEAILHTIKTRAQFLCGVESVETTLKNLEEQVDDEYTLRGPR